MGLQSTAILWTVKPTPSPSPTLVEAVSVVLPSWDAWATLIAAVIAALLAWITLASTRTHSRREHAFLRLGVALDHLYSGNPNRARQGVAILRSLRRSRWLTDDDRKMVINAIDTYLTQAGVLV